MNPDLIGIILSAVFVAAVVVAAFKY